VYNLLSVQRLHRLQLLQLRYLLNLLNPLHLRHCRGRPAGRRRSLRCQERRRNRG
jgi:hypothetical protein